MGKQYTDDKGVYELDRYYTIGSYLMGGMFPYWDIQGFTDTFYYRPTPSQEFLCTTVQEAKELLEEFTSLFGNAEGCRVVAVNVKDYHDLGRYMLEDYDNPMEGVRVKEEDHDN